VLSLLTIASFSYLMNWLSRQDAPQQAEEQQAGTVSQQAASPPAGTVSQSAVPPAADVHTAETKDTGGTPSEAAIQGPQLPAPSVGGGKAGTVKLSFIGDVMFASKVEDLLKKNGWEYPYQYVADDLKKADITMANLETPLTSQGKAQSKDYVYRSSPEALPALQAAGIDLVTGANNHIMDYGETGLLDTLDSLDNAGLKRVGMGRNFEEAFKPVIMEHNGVKIAFFGFSRVVPDTSWFATVNKPGVAGTYVPDQALKAIAEAREQADLVVVFAHWGVERQDSPVKEQTELAHQYIDQGADLVVASHPHVVQGFEQYKGKWIAYSLGNFIFTTNEDANTWDSMILNAECTKERTCDLQMVPILTKWAQPVKMTEEDGAKLFDKMGRISINARVDTDGKVIQEEKAKAPAPPVVKKAAETKKTSGVTSEGGAKSGASTNGAATKSTPASGTKKEGSASSSSAKSTSTTQTKKKTEP